jgi:hypothetical protein
LEKTKFFDERQKKRSADKAGRLPASPLGKGDSFTAALRNCGQQDFFSNKPGVILSLLTA